MIVYHNVMLKSELREIAARIKRDTLNISPFILSAYAPFHISRKVQALVLGDGRDQGQEKFTLAAHEM